MKITRVFALLCTLAVMSFNISTTYAQEIVRQKLSLKAGTLSLSRDDDNMVWTLKLNKKVLLKDENDNAAVGGPYSIGDYELVSFGSACAGSSCGDDYSTQLLLIDGKGNFTKVKTVDLNGKNGDSFDCAWFLDDKTNPMVKDGKLSFQCMKMDGRKHKTIYWTYDNGVVKESRTSDVWKK